MECDGEIQELWFTIYELNSWIMNHESRFSISRFAWWGLQQKYAWRLFIKNTAPCELARGCIGGDTWPMPEGQTTGLYASHSVWCQLTTNNKQPTIRGKKKISNSKSCCKWLVVSCRLHRAKRDAYGHCCKPWWMSAVTITVLRLCLSCKRRTQGLGLLSYWVW